MSRRERVREATREEIKALARQQMAASGTTALALNAIARALGMVPSALYRYYPDRDALITALNVDAFESLAEALHAADQSAPATAYGARLLATTCVYRSWALDHPVDFQLIFGAPIPGYQAPIEQTGPAMQHVFAVFLDILQTAHDAGQLRPVSNYQPAALEICDPDDIYGKYAPPVMYSGLVGWTTMHGVVALELVGQLQFSLTDPKAFFVGQLQTYIADLGLATNTS